MLTDANSIVEDCYSIAKPGPEGCTVFPHNKIVPYVVFTGEKEVTVLTIALQLPYTLRLVLNYFQGL